MELPENKEVSMNGLLIRTELSSQTRVFYTNEKNAPKECNGVGCDWMNNAGQISFYGNRFKIPVNYQAVNVVWWQASEPKKNVNTWRV